MNENRINRIDHYGKIVFKLDKIMKEKNLSKNKVAVLSGLGFQGVQGYYNGTISRIDCDVLARLCEATDSKVEDLIEYIPKGN